MFRRIAAATTAGILVVVLATAIAVIGDTAAGSSVDRADTPVEPPHRVRPIAATHPLTAPVDGALQAQARLAAAREYERAVNLLVLRQELARQEHERAAAAALATRQRASATHPSSGSGGSGVLDCIRHRESRGNYGVTNRSSGAAGAYQFMQGTWNSTARAAGRSDLVGVNPAAASASDQDAMARHLLATQGLGPWGGGCG